ncbi:hypothetical protein C7974DRAFT_380856 [Boeremia exigua]|uniref:uncharacterized protein n=1 Tax=Boeremia exigua TaxID=749465 RepID=UPI001E8E5F67|nr:uncharacterized protein C7974DRAFT_380856 [Boeremia exigua]KAH6613137.1 hypothetical protein C7974DRAFT_380856 [Boeremia exigua]
MSLSKIWVAPSICVSFSLFPSTYQVLRQSENPKKMQNTDCGCALLALRTLARVEEITTSSQVPLETALHITSTVEQPSLSVLSCERCRQQRVPLTAVTVLCAHLVDWLCLIWDLDNEDTATNSTELSSTTTSLDTLTPATANTTNAAETQHTTRYTTKHANRPWKFSFGSYDVAADEAYAVSIELMTLRLTGLSGVLGSLEAALVTSGSSSFSSSPSSRGTNETADDKADFAPAYLDLVRTNLRRVRACIRRLKAQSLLVA